MADAETAARVEAELAEPDNIYARFFQGLKERDAKRPARDSSQAANDDDRTSPRSKLQEIAAYLSGEADAETAARVEAELSDPDNDYARLIRGLKERDAKRPARDSSQAANDDDRS